MPLPPGNQTVKGDPVPVGSPVPMASNLGNIRDRLTVAMNRLHSILERLEL